MKFLVYLMTMLFVGSAIAQNPTILQGSYISNVFGNSNFVLNPNAQTNIANVTTVTATVTRSTTTPLVATSEFTVAIGTANGTATWATRAFDAGMKNNNCEARFTYRGFAATSKVHIKQGANTVASLTLTPATDPRIASINFPCGDLSTATTFVVTDTAILAGTNEIGGIYVGLATNMANVAQAEMIVRAYISTAQTIATSTETKVAYNTELLDVNNEFNTSTNTFTATRAGRYEFSGALMFDSATWAINNVVTVGSSKNVSTQSVAWYPVQNAISNFFGVQYIQSLELSAGDTAHIVISQNSGANKTIFASALYSNLVIKRFPSSSELVVTPERQNTWGGVQYRGAGGGLLGVHSGSTAPTAYAAFNNAVWNQPTMLKGKASLATSSVNDLGFSIANLPVGSYGVTASGFMVSSTGGTAGERVRCNFRVRETTTSTVVAQQAVQNFVVTAGGGVADTRNYPHSFSGVYNNTSVATRNFILEAQKFTDTTGTGTAGACEVFSDNTTNSFNTDITILLTPLDQPSNSALYVQGPVLGAQTGAAIPAGYFGDVLSDNVFTIPNACATGTRTLSTPIPPGVWLVQLTVDNPLSSAGNFAMFDFTFNGSTTKLTNAEVWQYSPNTVRTQGTETMVIRNSGTITNYTYQCTNGTGNLIYVTTTYLRLN